MSTRDWIQADNDAQPPLTGATLPQTQARLYTLLHEANGVLSTKPLDTPLHYEVRDYADAGLRIDIGASALNESLPNGQLQRTIVAYNLLREGVEDLGRWLRARGVGV